MLRRVMLGSPLHADIGESALNSMCTARSVLKTVNAVQGRGNEIIFQRPEKQVHISASQSRKDRHEDQHQRTMGIVLIERGH